MNPWTETLLGQKTFSPSSRETNVLKKYSYFRKTLKGVMLLIVDLSDKTPEIQILEFRNG